MTGIAGLNFVTDLIKVISDNWRLGNGGKMPTIEKAWEIKQVGAGTNTYDYIVIHLDTENIDIFSIQYDDENDEATWDWLHDISISLEVASPTSETRVLQIVNELSRILKKKVILNVNNRDYIQIVLNGATSMNAEYINMYRYLVTCESKILNP